MSVTAHTGPIVAFGQGTYADNNQDLGPSSWMAGDSLMDARRPYQPGGASTAKFYGWFGTTDIPVVNQVPSAVSANNIAASQALPPFIAAPFTLFNASGAGITVGASVVNALTGETVNNLLAIDGLPGALAFGATGAVNIYDPTTAISRAVSIHCDNGAPGGVITISGYDYYGYPLTDAVSLPDLPGSVTSLKAFKFIQSMTTNDGLLSGNVTVGTSDVYGLPLRADAFFQTSIVWNNTTVTASAGFVPADQTSPSTKTTGDVRGTYATQSASDGVKALQISITPSPNAIASGSVNGLAGIALAITGVTPV